MGGRAVALEGCRNRKGGHWWVTVATLERTERLALASTIASSVLGGSLSGDLGVVGVGLSGQVGAVVARWAHNPKAVGSNPAPDPKETMIHQEHNGRSITTDDEGKRIDGDEPNDEAVPREFARDEVRDHYEGLRAAHRSQSSSFNLLCMLAGLGGLGFAMLRGDRVSMVAFMVAVVALLQSMVHSLNAIAWAVDGNNGPTWQGEGHAKIARLNRVIRVCAELCVWCLTVGFGWLIASVIRG